MDDILLVVAAWCLLGLLLFLLTRPALRANRRQDVREHRASEELTVSGAPIAPVDGSGYPGSLSGVRIPVASRIMAVCDAYGAMTEERAYRERRGPQAALSELRDLSGDQFDPAVVDALEAEVGRETLMLS